MASELRSHANTPARLQLLAFGRNVHGQLGVGDRFDRDIPWPLALGPYSATVIYVHQRASQRTHSLDVSSYMTAADGEQARSFAAVVSVMPVSCPALTDSEIRIGIPDSGCLSHTFRCVDITWGSLWMGRKYAWAWTGMSVRYR